MSPLSRYRGTPFEVSREMPGTLRLQPKPNGPLPLPVLNPSDNCGCKPPLPGGRLRGTVKLPVPVCRSGENFSPIPLSAPPPCGTAIKSLIAPALPLISRPGYRTCSGRLEIVCPWNRCDSYPTPKKLDSTFLLTHFRFADWRATNIDQVRALNIDQALYCVANYATVDKSTRL